MIFDFAPAWPLGLGRRKLFLQYLIFILFLMEIKKCKMSIMKFLPSLLFLLINLSSIIAQCNFPFTSGEVIMDAETGSIYVFDKTVSGKVIFRFNTIDPAKYPEIQDVQPCSSVDFIKPFFEEGDIIHTWEGKIYPVKAYQPRWDVETQTFTIIREEERGIMTEEIRLDWKWIKRIEKENDFQERLKRFNVGEEVFWKNDAGELLNGKIKYIYGTKNFIKIKRYTIDNKFLEEDIDIQTITIRPENSNPTLMDTIDMIRKIWRGERVLVHELEKKRKYMKENNLKELELDEEYRLYRQTGYDNWSDEQKRRMPYNYDFNSTCIFADKGEVVCFRHGYKGVTSTYDRRMYGEWKVVGENLEIENGMEKLIFKIEELYKKEWEHLVLILKKYEYKL